MLAGMILNTILWLVLLGKFLALHRDQEALGVFVWLLITWGFAMYCEENK